jgi:hypothetical protein
MDDISTCFQGNFELLVTVFRFLGLVDEVSNLGLRYGIDDVGTQTVGKFAEVVDALK